MYKNKERLEIKLDLAKNPPVTKICKDVKEKYEYRTEGERLVIQNKRNKVEALCAWQLEVSKTAYLNRMPDAYLLAMLNVAKKENKDTEMNSGIVNIGLDYTEKIDQILIDWVVTKTIIPDFNKRFISAYEMNELTTIIQKYLPEEKDRFKLASRLPVKHLADLKRNQIQLVLSEIAKLAKRNVYNTIERI